MTDVTTSLETTDPFLSVRVKEGRIDFLQFKRLEEHETGAFLDACRETLSRALRQHADERLAALMARFAPPPDVHREVVAAHVSERLEKARSAPPQAGRKRRWFPEQADGRDPSGAVHASVTANSVVILEAPFEAIAHPADGAAAIRAAVNLALDRLEGDVLRIAKRGGQPQEPVEPDWTSLARLVDRLRKGYL